MILVALGVVTWLAVGPSLAWLMRRHGYDPIPWLLLGLLCAPLAVILAFVELTWPTSYSPRVLAPGQMRQGSLDVLVNLDAWPRSLEAAAKALAHLRPRLRTLGLTRVLPRGGGRLAERQAAVELRRDAAALGVHGAHVVLLLGRPEQALGQYAATANYSPVITTGQPGLTHVLNQSGQAARNDRDRQSPDNGLENRIADSPYLSSPSETDSGGGKTQRGERSERSVRRPTCDHDWRDGGAKACN